MTAVISPSFFVLISSQRCCRRYSGRLAGRLPADIAARQNLCGFPLVVRVLEQGEAHFEVAAGVELVGDAIARLEGVDDARVLAEIIARAEFAAGDAVL